MIDKPRLKCYLTVFPLADNTWGIRGGSEELWRIKLTDPRAIHGLGALLPLLDGRYHRAEILDRLDGGEAGKELAAKLLQKLEDSGFLEESGSAGLDPAEAAAARDQITFFSRFTSQGGATLQARLRSVRVGLLGDSPFRERVLDHLSRAGVGEVVLLTGEPGETAPAVPGLTKIRFAALHPERLWPDEPAGELPEILVLAQEASAPLLLDAVDAFSRGRGVPWLLLRATEPQEGWVGPLFIPGETASYRSLEARLKGNLPFFAEHEAFDAYLRTRQQTGNCAGGLQAFHDVLAAIGVAELIKLFTGIDVPLLAGRFVTIDYTSWTTELHTVLKVPHLEDRAQSKPALYAWKEPPYGEIKTRRA